MDQQPGPPAAPENASDTDNATVQIMPLDQGDGASERTKRLRHNLYVHPCQRKLILRSALVVVIVLLTVVMLTNNMLSIGAVTSSTLNRLFPAPSPTLPPLPGSNLYYLDVNVPNEQVAVDGHLLPHVQRLGVDAPLAFSQGSHVIKWLAYPFRPQSCTVSAPYAFGDTCNFAPYELSVPHKDFAAPLLLLDESLSTLPVSLQQSLVETVQATIDHIHDSVPVQVGELYLAEPVMTARQSLIATLHFSFDMQPTVTSDLVIDGVPCQQLCVAPWHFPDSSAVPLPQTPGTWLSVVQVMVTWDYTTPDGRVVARDQPIDGGGAGSGAHPILVRITRMNSGWQVTPLIGAQQAPPLIIYSGLDHSVQSPADAVPLPDNPSCVAAQDLFQGNNDISVRHISGPNMADGCLVAETVLASAPVGYYLEHFGVLLAVNSTAHTTSDWLPLADAYERGLAHQLLTLPGQSSQFSSG